MREPTAKELEMGSSFEDDDDDERRHDPMHTPRLVEFILFDELCSST